MTGNANSILKISFFLLIGFFMAGCGGGGGGGGDDIDDIPFSGGTGTGANGVTTFWQYFGPIGDGNAVTQTEDGGFILAGNKGEDFDFTTKNMCLVKTDSQGAAVWSRSFGGEEGQTANDVIECPDGGFFAVGYTDAGNSRDIFAVKTDSAGNLEWSRTYDAQGGNDEGYAVCSLSEGYAIAGSGVRDMGDGQMRDEVWFFKIDENGQKVSGSDRFYSGTIPGWYRAYDMASTREGGYVLTGRGEPGAVLVMKISADGTLEWQNDFGTGVGYAVCQAPAPDNGFVITGSTTQFDSNASDLLVIKISSTGAEQWRKVFGGTSMDVGRDVVPTPDNSYLIAGGTDSFSQGDQPYQRDDVYLVKLASNGNTRWQKVKGMSPDNSELAYGAVVASDGGYVVTGSSQTQVMLAKFDKNGNTVALGNLDFAYTVPETTGLITQSNALQVAAAGLAAVVLPTRVGTFGMDLFAAALSGMPVADLCDAGGSYAWNPAPTAPVADAGTYTLTFSSCTSGNGIDAVTYAGLLTLAVDSATGDLAGDDYNANITLNPVSVTTTDDVGDIAVSGRLAFSRISDAGNFTQRAWNNGGNLSRTEDDQILTITQFDISSTRSSTGVFTVGNAGQTATVDPSFITGALTVTISASLTGTDTEEPENGEIMVRAQDGSELTLSVSDGNISISVDTDADGTIDATLSTTWDKMD